MKLCIQQLVIEKNGIITQNLHFKNGVSLVEGSVETQEIIQIVLGIPKPVRRACDIRFMALVEIDTLYCVRGHKPKGETTFAVSAYRNDTECSDAYVEMLSQTSETDASLRFCNVKRQDYSRKFAKYKDLLTYYPNGEFAKLTNGYGITRSFRGFLHSYITHFKPIRLRRDKDLYLKLSNDGIFHVGYRDGDDEVYLSESENILYHYLSFISMADFWERAERIRNLHVLKKPLIVSNFLEFLDDSIDISDILDRTAKLDRQVILFVERNDLYGE